MRITGYESNQMILEELGQRMKDTRIAANYSQAEMAKHSGVALSTLARMERGESVTMENLLNPVGGIFLRRMISLTHMINPTDGWRNIR